MLSLARDCRLNQTAKENADPADQNQEQADQGQSGFRFAVTAAAGGPSIKENTANYGEEEQTENE